MFGWNLEGEEKGDVDSFSPDVAAVEKVRASMDTLSK